jgi:hypothetical protein
MVSKYQLKRNIHIRALIKDIDRLGYRVYFTSSIDDLSRQGRDRDSDILGYCDHETRVVKIFLEKTLARPIMTIGDYIFVLAHELYHTQKRDLTKYVEWNQVEKLQLARIYKMLQDQYEEELSADRFARNYLKTTGYFSRYSHRRYSIKKIPSYEIGRFLGLIRKGQFISQEKKYERAFIWVYRAIFRIDAWC